MDLRSPYFAFSALGVILLLVALIFDQLQVSFASQTLVNLGSSVLIVVIVEWLWKHVGGDPLIQALSELRHLSALTRDVERAGLARIYLRRRDVDFDSVMLYAKTSKEIDLMGINLLETCFGNPSFLSLMSEDNPNRKIRIIILDPAGPIAKQRAVEEGDDVGNLITECKTSISRFKNIVSKNNEEFRSRVILKLSNNTTQYCSVLRFDSRMFITLYLAHLPGGFSVTLEVTGKDSGLFDTYTKEFERLWGSAIELPVEN